MGPDPGWEHMVSPGGSHGSGSHGVGVHGGTRAGLARGALCHHAHAVPWDGAQLFGTHDSWCTGLSHPQPFGTHSWCPGRSQPGLFGASLMVPQDQPESRMPMVSACGSWMA